METLGITHSVCATCKAVVPAKIVTDGRDVYFRKFCPEHGESESFVRSDAAGYLAAQRYVKPAWVPREFAAGAKAQCPEGCGFCARHEQHLCMPIVEVTSRCDLACPVCIADAGGTWDMAPDEFRRILDAIIRAEGQVHVLNLSGGEPLMHPRLIELVDEAVSRPEVARVSISTNGLRFLTTPRTVEELRERNVCISLQFDGFDEAAYEVLRGARLLDRKLRILDLLESEDIATSLTVTAARGVNEDQFPRLLDYLFSHRHVVSMMIQPVAFAGRGAGLPEAMRRLTIPDVVRLLGSAGHPSVAETDFVPLPCSHPLCFSLAFYLLVGGSRPLSLNRIVRADEYLDALANRPFFGMDGAEREHLKEMIYELWSGPAAASPDVEGVIRTVRNLLRETACCASDLKKVFAVAERSVKSIFIHAFQDADTFDLARVRRCCNAYPLADGRLMPACAFNVLHRGKDPRFCGSAGARARSSE